MKNLRDEKMHKIKDIQFTKGTMSAFIDGKEYNFDLKKVSKALSKANMKEKEMYNISASGYIIHWPLIDEDISIDRLLRSLKK
jgi:hypothetical protein